MKTKRLLHTCMVTLLIVCTPVYGRTLVGQADHDFQTFLNHFTNSAAFQYSRIKFPLKTPIKLMSEDGSAEKTFPFTKEKWPLLTKEMLTVTRTTQEGGGTYIAKYTEDTFNHKIFEAGNEDSEIDLHVVFDLINGEWFVTDCFCGYYSYDMSPLELREAIQYVKKENQTFINAHP